jgi:hypothetical protein
MLSRAKAGGQTESKKRQMKSLRGAAGDGLSCRGRTEVRRSDPDARGNTTDTEYIYVRNRSNRGLELTRDEPV